MVVVALEMLPEVRIASATPPLIRRPCSEGEVSMDDDDDFIIMHTMPMLVTATIRTMALIDTIIFLQAVVTLGKVSGGLRKIMSA